jgi:tetratricopeptide (TPR) repeat protein
MVYVEQGKKSEAMATLDAAIVAHPESDSAYIAKSIILKREGKAMQGREVLLQGLEATNGGTAELHNALGLSYVDTREYERAREHARKAYGMGYPLPGLMNKLAKAGYPL